MLVLRSLHQAIVNGKETQIADLQEQVRFLREMVKPKAEVSGHASFRIATEANAVLDGQQNQILLPEPSPEDPDIVAERDRIFSGTY